MRFFSSPGLGVEISLGVRKYDLAERLINFADACMNLGEALPRTFTGKHIAEQLIRSSTSPALHYGEAQAAESSADFIHKMKICLKELRETAVCLKLVEKRKWYDENELKLICIENIELISIFNASITTALRNKSSRAKS
jgi:four helix bundle protein